MNNINNIQINEREVSSLALSLINSKQYQKAEILLLKIPSSGKKWYKFWS